MPNRFASVLTASVLPLAASSALAQSPPAASTTLPGVTVQGPAKPKVIQQQARSFVDAYTATTAKIGQIARWHTPVCVQVEGVVPVAAAQVKARVEEVARDVGLPVMKPGCRSNIQIVFSDQPQRLMDKVGEQYLGFHYRGEIRKARAVTQPVQSWYMTATQGGGTNNAPITTAVSWIRQVTPTPPPEACPASRRSGRRRIPPMFPPPPAAPTPASPPHA